MAFDSARYYDPNLGRFISVDTIAPGLKNPQNRNRYSYVMNNPLNYTDPTGHCGKKTDVAAETQECVKQIDELNTYGVLVGDLAGGLWSSHQLRWVVQAIKLMAYQLFDSNIETFRSKIGSVTIEQSANANGWSSSNPTAPAVTWGAPLVGSKITFYQDSFNLKGGAEAFKRLVVHELGHAWDAASGGMAGRSLRLATGSEWVRGKYSAGGTTTGYGAESDAEDWAESVAETVYDPPSRHGGNIDKTRECTVRQTAGSYLPGACK